jgi:basic membrane protein A
MKVRILRKALVVIVPFALVAAACGSSSSTTASSSPCKTATGKTGNDIKVAIVFDVGGLGDQGFNDLSKKGLDQAISDGLIQQANTKYVEPDATGSNRDELLANFADEGYNLIIAASFVFSPGVDKLAAEHCDEYFAVVDGYAGEAANVTNLTFRENEGSYLVGAAAAMKT